MIFLRNRLMITGILIFILSCNHAKRKEPYSGSGNSFRSKSLRDTADLLYKSKRYAEVIPYLDSLIQLDPKNGGYYFCRGYAYDQVYKTPELKQAIADYTKSIELGYEVADSYFNIALSYTFVDDSLAVYNFERCLKYNPNKAIAILMLYECKGRLKDKNRK